MLADVSQDSAVNIQDMSVDEVGCVISQEYCRSLQIFRCSPACCRCLGNDELVERMSESSVCRMFTIKKAPDIQRFERTSRKLRTELSFRICPVTAEERKKNNASMNSRKYGWR